MSCVAPVLVKNERRKSSDFAFHRVPCGKCLPCIKKRKSQWIFRLKEEMKVSSNVSFLTLTYSDENLVYGSSEKASLDKRAFPLFMKRLRKRISDIPLDVTLKYYAVGEYGDVSLRPHYHAILFNLPDVFTAEILTEIWDLGFVRVDSVQDAALAYVVGYVDKKLLKVSVDDRQPEFSLMSKGLGKSYLTDSVKSFYQKKKVPYLLGNGGKKISLPRYYRDKMFTEEDRAVIAAKAVSHIESLPMVSEKDRIESIDMEMHNFEKELLTKRKKL